MESKKSHLILFTSSFPYGDGEQFIESEILYLSNEFDIVTILPYSFGGNRASRKVPENVNVNYPLKPEGFSPFKLLIKGIFNLVPFGIFWDELICRKFFGFRYKHLAFWLRHTLTIRMLASDKTLKTLICDKKNKTVVYFYWGKIHSAIIPFIDKTIPCVVKFHGSDLYEERDKNIGFILFRKQVLQHLNTAIFISNDGKEYQTKKYSDVSFKCKTFRLGVNFQGETKQSKDECLRIVSCSSLKKLKRVHLIAEALKNADFPVIWTHIGDGPERASIDKTVQQFPAKVKSIFLGHISNREVYDYYQNNPVDLFINISEYEGVPVSIMEALSFSIPVFGSAVGGIPELVDNSVGRLIPVEIDSLTLSQLLKEFYNLPIAEKRKIREQSFIRWKEFANAESNYKNLSTYLKKLV